MMLRLPELLCKPLMIDYRALPGLFQLSLDEVTNHRLMDEDMTPKEPTLNIALHSDLGNQLSLDALDTGEDGDFAPGSITAVVPLVGVVTRHGYMSWFSSSPGTLEIGRQLDRLDANPAVGQVVMFINTPGGEVSGTPELSEKIYNLREAKRTKFIGVVDNLMASAGTYIGTACETLYAIPTADVGSVGVISSYTEYSKYLEKSGITIETQRIPDKKARFTGVEPMDDDMRETVAKRNNEAYEKFVADLARNRNISETDVRSDFGGGEVMSAEAGIEANMIDAIGDLDSVLLQLVKEARERNANHRRAMADQRKADLAKLA